MIFFFILKFMLLFPPELVFAPKKNLNLLLASAPYLLHRALKISEMSDCTSFG